MDELKNLKDRMTSALARIENAGAQKDPAVSTLAAENAALQDRLKRLQAAREADRAELDALINQIRPLIEGGENA